MHIALALLDIVLRFLTARCNQILLCCFTGLLLGSLMVCADKLRRLQPPLPKGSIMLQLAGNYFGATVGHTTSMLP